MNREFPVDESAREFFFCSVVGNLQRTRLWTPLRTSLRLICGARRVQFSPLPTSRSANNVIAAVHRFEESIAGRLYLIEVAGVSEDRWRAQIVRLPGVPTAMMPFYGRTPDEAARNLSEWLTRAHRRAATLPSTA